MKLLSTLAIAALAAVGAAQNSTLNSIANAQSPAPGGATGTAKGRVVFEGEKPEVKPLDISADKAKGCVHDGESLDTRDLSLLIGKENGIQNVVLTIEVPDAKVKVPEKPVLLDQKKCVFEPHVMVVPAGAQIEFKNSDSVQHNVHLLALKNEGWNHNLAAGAKETAKFDKSDKIQIACDYHPWMKSWLIVTETPFVAVTDADGNFSIAGLPPGEFKATFWHEKLGKGSATIKVGADGKVDPLEFKMSEKKPADGRRK